MSKDFSFKIVVLREVIFLNCCVAQRYCTKRNITIIVVRTAQLIQLLIVLQSESNNCGTQRNIIAQIIHRWCTFDCSSITDGVLLIVFRSESNSCGTN